MVIGVRGLCAHVSYIESLGNVQGHQRRDALAVRRALVNGRASIIGRYRLVPVRVVLGKIVLGDPAALVLDEIGDLLRHVALVEGVLAILGNLLERVAQFGQLHDLALLRRTAVLQHLAA